MKREFEVCIRQDGNAFIAQCLEIDVQIGGKTEEKALENLKKEIRHYFKDDPRPFELSLKVVAVEVNTPIE